MRVLIAGGGIGGLVTALCRHRGGVDGSVHESAEEFRPLGVGMNRPPHAARVLTTLGSREQREDTAIATAELGSYAKCGRPIWREPRGRAAARCGQRSPRTPPGRLRGRRPTSDGRAR